MDPFFEHDVLSKDPWIFLAIQKKTNEARNIKKNKGPTDKSMLLV